MGVGEAQKAEERVSDPFKWDVAISLRAADAELAGQLADALAPLRVFLFTRRQQDLGGANQVEVFTETFRRDARLSVVLHRKEWGASDYTDLESLAIQERGLRTRWRSVFLVKLDDSEAPLWFAQHVLGYVEYPRYSIAEVAGAIRARAEELGAVARVETLTEYHARLAKAAADERDRQTFAASTLGLAAARAEVGRLFNVLEQQCELLRGVATDFEMRSAERDGR